VVFKWLVKAFVQLELLLLLKMRRLVLLKLRVLSEQMLLEQISNNGLLWWWVDREGTFLFGDTPERVWWGIKVVAIGLEPAPSLVLRGFDEQSFFLTTPELPAATATILLVLFFIGLFSYPETSELEIIGSNEEGGGSKEFCWED